MPQVKKPIDRVRDLIDAGAPRADAIRIVLGGSIPKWAQARGISRTPASLTISGRRVPPDGKTFAALVEDLEATEEEVREILAEATREIVAVAS